MYKDWGNSVKMLVQPYFPGMIRPIARNFFTLVYVINPATKVGRNLLIMADSFLSHQVPIRIGVIWAVNGDKDATSGMNDAGVALVNLFNFEKQDTDSSLKALKIVCKVGKFDAV